MVRVSDRPFSFQAAESSPTSNDEAPDNPADQRHKFLGLAIRCARAISGIRHTLREARTKVCQFNAHTCLKSMPRRCSDLIRSAMGSVT
jgi:hypothetical protein